MCNMSYSYKEIGERIRNNRKKLNLSQNDFCEELDKKGYPISRKTLSKIENGEFTGENFSIKLLLTLCEVFSCDTGHLLGEYNQTTKKEQIIQEEIHLSRKAISNLKKNMNNSITPATSASIMDVFRTEIEQQMPENETFIHSLNLILEKYPELIALIGRIMLHEELSINNDYISNVLQRPRKSYDIDKDLLNLVISLKYYMENNKKIPSRYINDTKRYEYAVQFITKHMQTLEKDNAYLSHCLDELSRNSNEYYCELE